MLPSSGIFNNTVNLLLTTLACFSETFNGVATVASSNTNGLTILNDLDMRENNGLLLGPDVEPLSGIASIFTSSVNISTGKERPVFIFGSLLINTTLSSDFQVRNIRVFESITVATTRSTTTLQMFVISTISTDITFNNLAIIQYMNSTTAVGRSIRSNTDALEANVRNYFTVRQQFLANVFFEFIDK